ncbi:MAG: hypothetical protein A3A72_03845 [Deltaproteobacteria bacterium RIFCSPLOWO2_01_FULL_38_9]|nr:MAG: hypothetical protein A3A72_03845 [Deltaproteobacteria bacterium RIFCSPLOWO2_01_FULL_38_9]
MNTQKRILLVDDEQHIIITVKARLKANNYDVLAVGNKETALEQIAQYKPDLIISDTLGNDGYSLCQILRNNADYKGIPIMLLSAQAQKRYVLMGYAAGATYYMIKPFDSQEFLAKIRELLKEN